ncbi:MAG: hypothetical protein KAI24_26305, partial [Planctomycetes bacterium]|nr:hypothetical protein [Planctomycetota bacterium]
MKTFAMLVFALSAGSVAAQQDPAMLDAGRITSGEFRTERFGPARWLDGAHYATLEPNEGADVLEL